MKKYSTGPGSGPSSIKKNWALWLYVFLVVALWAGAIYEMATFPF